MPLDKVDIIDFVARGRLRTIPFGLSRQSVVDIFDDNPGWTIAISKRDKRPALIKYDKVEFYFDSSADQLLWGLQITYSEPADKKRLDVDYGDFKDRLRYNEVKEALDKHGISFKESVSSFDTQTQTIVTQSGVRFYFFDDMTLEKFGRFIS